MDQWLYGWSVVGWMNRWTDQWLDGWVVLCMNGWMGG